MSEEIRTPGFCALCKSRCGSVMVTKDGEFLRQEPNPEHPTGRALCVKGRAAAEIVYRPSRQLHPMRRTRPKGDPDPGWVRISWEEALARTAEALNRLKGESGAQSVAFGWTTPSGTPFSDDLRWVERFTNAFGSPNVAYGVEVCNWHKDNAHAYTVGRSIGAPDFENTRCVVLWGHNPSATWLDHATGVAAAVARGAKLIVVDPRRVGFASRADQWLRVRPGTDGALALGIAHEMLRNRWFNEDFVRRWTNGALLVRRDTGRFLRALELAEDGKGTAHQDDLVAWSRGMPVRYVRASRRFDGRSLPELFVAAEVLLRDGTRVVCDTAMRMYERLCAQFPPERVSEVCWVGKEQVTETARLLHEAGPVCYYAWSGVGQHSNATQTDRAMAILMSLTGSIEAPGGNVSFARPPSNDVSASNLMTPEQRANCIELAHSRLGPGRDGWIGSVSMYKAMIEGVPYRVRGMVNFGRNFIVNYANPGRGADALAKLEFMVHADVVMNPTAAYADIFLPINTPWERESLRVSFEGSAASERLIQLRQAAIEPRGESRSDAYVVFELAKRMGMSDLFWNGDIQAGLNHVLAPSGLTLDALRAIPNGYSYPVETEYRTYETKGFKTATGLIEVYSEVFHAEGQPPLPVYVEPATSPIRANAEDFPLVLTTAKVVQYCHGQHRDIASLRRRAPHPEVNIHPDAAAIRGIDDGDEVEVRTPNGAATMRAKFDRGLDERVVCAQYGWWQSNEALELPGSDPLSASGANINRVITDDHIDPISGSIGLRSAVCDIAVKIASAPKAWRGWRDFKVIAAHRESPDIASFTLAPVDGAPLVPFIGGQHLAVRVSVAGGGFVVRCYSLSAGHDPGHYRISVKRLGNPDGSLGAASGALHALARTEDAVIALRPPGGAFHLRLAEPGAPLLLVAAGIGITPMLSILHQCRQQASARPITLLYGVRCEQDHAFRQEIESLKQMLPNLTVLVFFSAPSDEDRDLGRFDHAGRIDAARILAAWTPATHVFLCGPGAMVGELKVALCEAGIPSACIHAEAFGPSAVAVASESFAEQAVTFAKSGGTMTWVPGKGSLLDQMAAAGRIVSSGCRAGQCESCIIDLLEGEVAHPVGTSSVDDDKCLPCVCVPLSAVKLNV